MRIYSGCLEMDNEERRNLHELGTIVHPETMQDKHVADDAAYATLELSPCVFTILKGIEDMDDLIRARQCNLDWCHADFAERVTGVFPGERPVNPGAAWRLREAVWEEFIHHGRFAYSYSERLNAILYDNTRALARVIAELRARPNTRQAVLPVFQGPIDLANMGGRARIPCSMHYQFTRRADGLRLTYVMRSTDFITHFPYDVWMALRLQEFVAHQLDVAPGPFTFFTNSLHIYRRDVDDRVF